MGKLARRSMMKRFVLIMLFICMLLFSSISIVAQENQKDEYIILYDEAHQQYFNTTMMQTALQSLSNKLDKPVKLIVQKQAFNQSNLQGVDLVIITNPGLTEDGSVNAIDQNEVNPLKTYIDNGGSVFFLSNPISDNPDLAGHAAPMNDFFKAVSGVQMEVEVDDSSDFDNTTAIIDDYNFYQNNTYVYVYPDNMNTPVFAQELNNVTKANGRFLYYGGDIVSRDSGATSTMWGNTSQFAYVVEKGYTITKFQESPKWMYAKDFGEGKGRGLLMGSTIMFSDLSFNSTQKWINVESNLQLFQNIVAWLLHITPVPADEPIVTENFAFFLRSDLFYAIVAGGAFFFLLFGFYTYQGKLKISHILKIREGRAKGTHKDRSSSDAKNKKSSPGTKQRERRKRT